MAKEKSKAASESGKDPAPAATTEESTSEADKTLVPGAVPPVVTVTEPEPIPVQEAASPEKMVTVTPRVTITSVRIGNDWYSFLKGTPVKVPASVRAHLEEKGVI